VTTATRPRLSYRPELDGVRAIAVLAVLGYHIAYVVPQFNPYFRGGFLGVDVFFVLSGMLITELLVNDFQTHGKVSIRSFYRRRAQRLLPALVVFLGLVVAYYQVVHHEGWEILRGLWSVGVYVTTGHALAIPDPPAVTQCWTLLIEWEFYLFWPLILAVLLHRGYSLRSLGYGTLIAAAGVTTVRAVLMLTDGGNWALSYFLAWLRFDELLVGCALGLIGAMPRAPGWLRTVALAGIITMFTQVTASDHWLYLGGMFGLAIATAIVVQPRRKRVIIDYVLGFPPLVWLGRLSYSLYLWSNLTVSEFGAHPAWSNWVRIPAYTLGSLVLAAASYYLVERRFRLPSRTVLSEADARVPVPDMRPAADPPVTDGTRAAGR
jgi:peptidoglycan/LPS O-acetylase OafA/YrhL